jgi:hypothetical protein
MSKLLESLERRIQEKVQERLGVLEPKLDEMIRLLRQIEENTRKGK